MAGVTKLSNENPVGFFDSGVGGLCILNAFKRLCPHESTVYLADSANCPYGNRSPAEIVRFSRKNVRYLLKRHAKLIVVACNTASAAAIDNLRQTWPEIPFVGMEPAVKPAALRSKTRIIGVLATAGTFQGRLYRETCARWARQATVLACVADDFVRLVESGDTSSSRAEAIVRARVEPLLAAGADCLVLGCTHFPHLTPLIERVTAGRALLIDPSDAVARQIRRVLASQRLLNLSAAEPNHLFTQTCNKTT